MTGKCKKKGHVSHRHPSFITTEVADIGLCTFLLGGVGGNRRGAGGRGGGSPCPL